MLRRVCERWLRVQNYMVRTILKGLEKLEREATMDKQKNCDYCFRYLKGWNTLLMS